MIVYLLILILFYAIFKNCIEGIDESQPRKDSTIFLFSRQWPTPDPITTEEDENQEINTDYTGMPCISTGGFISLNDDSEAWDSNPARAEINVDDLKCQEENTSELDSIWGLSRIDTEIDTEIDTGIDKSSRLLFSDYNQNSTEKKDITLSEQKNSEYTITIKKIRELAGGFMGSRLKFF